MRQNADNDGVMMGFRVPAYQTERVGPDYHEMHENAGGKATHNMQHVLWGSHTRWVRTRCSVCFRGGVPGSSPLPLHELRIK